MIEQPFEQPVEKGTYEAFDRETRLKMWLWAKGNQSTLYNLSSGAFEDAFSESYEQICLTWAEIDHPRTLIKTIIKSAMTKAVAKERRFEPAPDDDAGENIPGPPDTFLETLKYASQFSTMCAAACNIGNDKKPPLTADLRHQIYMYAIVEGCSADEIRKCLAIDIFDSQITAIVAHMMACIAKKMIGIGYQPSTQKLGVKP